MPIKTIHIIGFGSQGSAWAQCFRKSGWTVQVYLSHQSESWSRATQLGFKVQSTEDLTVCLSDSSETHWVAMLCPDSTIQMIYEKYIYPSPPPIRLILAHGFAIYSKELNVQTPQHQVTLLAPKAIGPQLLQNFNQFFPECHSLKAAFSASIEDQDSLIQIAKALGFHLSSLIPSSFEQETVGDLMSEQGLLCGGVFNLLAWTMEAMAKAGIPDSLIQEECLTELELIAGLIRDRGPAKCFQAISQAAQCGTIAMSQRLNNSGFKKEFDAQMKSILNQQFVGFFNSSEWKPHADVLQEKLSVWEKRFSEEAE